MSIVLKLQKKCLNKDESLQDLFREALVISTKLKLNDFKKWINSELKGYEEEIPEYRQIHTKLKFFNPYHGWTSAVVNENLEDSLTKTKLSQPIGELEKIITDSKSNDDNLQLGLSGHQINMLRNLYTTDCEPAQFIDSIQIYGIIEKVRTLLLEWTLKLEEDGILGNDDLIFTEKEKEAAKNIHIENFNGVMGDISKLGNISTGNNSTNIYNENNISNEIDKLIKEIKKLNLKDENQVILDLEASKIDNKKAKTVLGSLLSRGSELASVGSMIISILGLL